VPAPSLASAAASAAIPPVDPVCRVESKKVWATGASKLAGLTESQLPDGRVAIGFAVGHDPRVLLVEAAGKGKVVKVPVAKTSRLSSLPKGATRFIERVTPSEVAGDEVKAFVDFEDRYPDKKRAVVCGRTDTNENWVEFEGIPFTARKKLKPEEISALFRQEGKERVYDEVHVCRTFASLDRREAWVMSSSLHGVLGAGDAVAWRSDFALATGTGGKKILIESFPIKDKTLDDELYEVPVSHALQNGSFLVAARQGRHLVVGFLNSDKSPAGPLSRYAGFPTLPDVASDGHGGLVLVTAFARDKGQFGLRAMRVDETKPQLPKSLHSVVTDLSGPDAESESDPDFVHDAQGQQWIAHIEGERGQGRLSLAPLNQNFHAIGRSYTVTEPGERASSARLVPLKDKGILVVFIRGSEKAWELVSEEVHCKVEQ
jgi:hypothetical protein